MPIPMHAYTHACLHPCLHLYPCLYLCLLYELFTGTLEVSLLPASVVGSKSSGTSPPAGYDIACVLMRMLPSTDALRHNLMMSILSPDLGPNPRPMQSRSLVLCMASHLLRGAG